MALTEPRMGSIWHLEWRTELGVEVLALIFLQTSKYVITFQPLLQEQQYLGIWEK